MDTIIFGLVQATATSSEELAATVPYPADTTTLATASTPPAATAPAAASVPASVTVPEDPWFWLGAKTKAPVSPTPSHPKPHQHWVLVRLQKEWRLSFPSFHTPVTHDIQLVNRYDILDLHEFPPLAGNPQPLPFHRTFLTSLLGFAT